MARDGQGYPRRRRDMMMMYPLQKCHHHHHHHHVVPLARISLTLSRHFSRSFIATGRSSGLHPVSSHSCWMYVRAGRPAFARPYVGVHRSSSLMSSSLLQVSLVWHQTVSINEAPVQKYFYLSGIFDVNYLYQLKICVLSMILNCIWWLDFIFGVFFFILGDVNYPFINIILGSTLSRIGCTC